MTAILILFLLILLNGLFSMSEIAMVTSRKARLEIKASKGDRSAKMALRFAEKPGKFLSTVQIGITIIGLLTGIYSGQQIEYDVEQYLNQFESVRPYSQTLAIAFILISLTYFSLVLGELVPKRIGLSNPERVSTVVAYPMYFISILMAPFIWLLTVSTDFLLKILGLKSDAKNLVTEEEINALIREGAASGTVQGIEQDIVENVFYLGDRSVKNLMTQRLDIDWLNTRHSPEVIKQNIIRSSHESFPVCNSELDHILGIVHSKDMLNDLLEEKPFSIEKHMKPAIFLTENTKAYIALEKLRSSRQNAAIVVDEFGDVRGILTLNDLMDALVGDLTQQLHDKKEIIPREDGSFLIDASLPLPEFIRYFEIDTDENDDLAHINTVGGLAFHFANNIPITGYIFQWKNFNFEIIDMDKRRIDKILVRRTEDMPKIS
ncbi:MAG: HlyC/CorC family transporter [Bacteroidetes bacterium]|nr:HlyC/CorC family transporter [Bacteroidota bacterium]